jgi:hypothetical protein
MVLVYIMQVLQEKIVFLSSNYLLQVTYKSWYQQLPSLGE